MSFFLSPARKTPYYHSYDHLCTTTLFTNPAASIVCVSSSSVRFGNVVPIVYGRVRFSGRDLQSFYQHTHSITIGMERNERIDKVPDVLDFMGQVHPTHDPNKQTNKRDE